MSSKIKYSSTILAPISIGELIDKITILNIKLKYVNDKKKDNLKHEHDLLLNELSKSSVQIDIKLIEKFLNKYASQIK